MKIIWIALFLLLGCEKPELVTHEEMLLLEEEQKVLGEISSLEEYNDFFYEHKVNACFLKGQTPNVTNYNVFVHSQGYKQINKNPNSNSIDGKAYVLYEGRKMLLVSSLVSVNGSLTLEEEKESNTKVRSLIFSSKASGDEISSSDDIVSSYFNTDQQGYFNYNFVFTSKAAGYKVKEPSITNPTAFRSAKLVFSVKNPKLFDEENSRTIELNNGETFSFELEYNSLSFDVLSDILSDWWHGITLEDGLKLFQSKNDITCTPKSDQYQKCRTCLIDINIRNNIIFR